MSLLTGPTGSARFHTTHWTVVLAAASGGTGDAAALEALCRTYWRPVHAFVRRLGHDAEEALDLTQGFFADLLERVGDADVDPARGRFRAYLMAAARHFVSKEHVRARALKRGGGKRPFSIGGPGSSAGIGTNEAEAMDLEDHGAWESETPESVFERQWALALLRRALERLGAEQASEAKRDLFERVKPALAGESVAGGYAAVADALGTSVVAVKVAVHRLRRRFRDLILEEVARTVEVPQDIEDELDALFRALSGGAPASAPGAEERLERSPEESP